MPEFDAPPGNNSSVGSAPETGEKREFENFGNLAHK